MCQFILSVQHGTRHIVGDHGLAIDSEPRCERKGAARWQRGGKKNVLGGRHSRGEGPEVRAGMGASTMLNKLGLDRASKARSSIA